MAVISTARAGGIEANATPPPLPAEWTSSRRFATNAASRVHDVTAPLLDALTDTVRSAGARGVNDTGARQAADALRDARIALDIAVTAAGRALAERDIPIRTL
jgi:hypothetical protein